MCAWKKHLLPIMQGIVVFRGKIAYIVTPLPSSTLARLVLLSQNQYTMTRTLQQGVRVGVEGVG